VTKYFNRRAEKPTRRALRSSMPNAEVLLWSRLKGRQLLGCKFRRQYSVGAFVLDFYCADVKLGIELDGDTHYQPGAREYDEKRKRFIGTFGIELIRILNSEVYDNLDGVLEMLGRELLERRAGTEPRQNVRRGKQPPAI
jgi:very-short-patch-repair endonuclease